MNLFYQNLTEEEQLSKLQRDTIQHLYNNIRKPKKLEILRGDKEFIGNCALFLIDHVKTQGFMRGQGENALVDTCNKYRIDNRMVSYSYLRQSKSVSRTDIVGMREFLYILISIVNPFLIVALGEKTMFSFINRKILLANGHGSVVHYYNEVPVILTYPIDYYKSRENDSDQDYKDYILENDWNFIKEEYERRKK